eukprot:369074-Pyramimonas_sp.AAC.1
MQRTCKTTWPRSAFVGTDLATRAFCAKVLPNLMHASALPNRITHARTSVRAPICSSDSGNLFRMACRMHPELLRSRNIGGTAISSGSADPQ